MRGPHAPLLQLARHLVERVGVRHDHIRAHRVQDPAPPWKSIGLGQVARLSETAHHARRGMARDRADPSTSRGERAPERRTPEIQLACSHGAAGVPAAIPAMPGRHSPIVALKVQIEAGGTPLDPPVKLLSMSFVRGSAARIVIRFSRIVPRSITGQRPGSRRARREVLGPET